MSWNVVPPPKSSDPEPLPLCCPKDHVLGQIKVIDPRAQAGRPSLRRKEWLGKGERMELDRENLSSQTFPADDNRPAELISLSGSLAAAEARQSSPSLPTCPEAPARPCVRHC